VRVSLSRLLTIVEWYLHLFEMNQPFERNRICVGVVMRFRALVRYGLRLKLEAMTLMMLLERDTLASNAA